MDLDAARDFVKANHRAVLATTRRDGRPQLSAVVVGVDSEGRAVVSSRETAMKVRNLRRDPRVSICVMSNDFRDWRQLDGTADVLSLPEAMEPLVDYYRQMQGEHPDWDDYRRAMAAERRVLVRVTIERAGPDVRG
jgi:PPOX class probable F420-dependent enzyme